MRVYKRAGTYQIDVSIRGSRVRRSLKTGDRATAQRRALKICAELEARGPEPWHSAALMVAPLIDAYLNEHYAARPNPRRRRERQRIICLVFARIKYLRHISGAKLIEGLSAARAKHGWATSTTNTYRDIVSAFCTWLVRRGYTSVNHCRRVAKLPEPPRRKRRALTPRELSDLLEGAPLHRASVYAVAAGIGLRRAELAALQWGDLDLTTATAHIRAETTKTRKRATLPMASWVVDMLTRWRNAWRPGTPTHPGQGEVLQPRPKLRVWSSVPHHTTVRRDFERAGIPKQTNQGHVDLHALRVTCGTMLARSGASLAVSMRLLRHSDPRLTLNVYAALVDDDLRAGVDALEIPGFQPGARRSDDRLDLREAMAD